MSFWSRIANALSSSRLNRELNEEYEAHIAEAIAQGRDPEEARRAFGALLRHREASRQHRVLGWLESLRVDLIFGLRQLKRNKITSAAAILSLGLAMGSCVGAFRLIDALLWRPLPIAHPERLYSLWSHGLAFDGSYQDLNNWTYPDFAQMRDSVRGRASLLAVSYANLTDLTYSTDQEMEKARLQYVSGSLFRLFGLQAAAGRLLLDADDATPGAEPYAVLSYDYWTRRFGRNPKVLGASVRIGAHFYQIIGVCRRPFTGTEPGTVTDIFVPAVMNEMVNAQAVSWTRIFVVIPPGADPGPLTRQLETVHRTFEAQQAQSMSNMTRKLLELMVQQKVSLDSAGAGVSSLQSDYRRALGALAVLIVLVLLIACVNVANLLTAQAAARQQEMALRISIGAGRRRLVQLVLIESALLALASALVALAFAWWSAPFVASRISRPDTPVRLILPADWRVASFALALTVAVTLLFGLLPALRASSVNPLTALKGGDNPHARKRLLFGMIAIQVAFCSLVVFLGGLFVTSFERLAAKPVGFDPDNLLLLDAASAKMQPSEVWNQVRASLEALPFVQQTAMTNIPLLSGVAWIGFVSTHGEQSPTVAYFSGVSPDWREIMKIPLYKGRDFRPSDSNPGVAIVNQTFARTYLPGIDPIGQSFIRAGDRFQIIGLISDAPYVNLREAPLPVAFVPWRTLNKNGEESAVESTNILVRLKPEAARQASLEAIAPTLRKTIAQAHAGFRVSNLRRQQELIDAQTIRERMLAMLALFFSAVALLLAGIGLFGVLNYTVLQRRREIGIRIAIGARRAGIAGLVARPIFAMIALGAIAGVAAGIFASRSIATLFYATKATDAAMLTLPAAAILAVALLAVLPAIQRAIQTDPAEILRAE